MEAILNNSIRLQLEVKSQAAIYLLILNVFDWISSYFLFQTNQMVEANPLVFNLHIVKFLACVLCLVIIFKSPQTIFIKGLVLGTNACYCVLTVWHVYLWITLKGIV
jgi:hypothetical protein